MQTEPLIALDPAWPVMTLPESEAMLTAPGGKFEIETIDIRGVPTRVWKHAPPNLSWLIQAARAYGANVFTIYEDERVTYEANYRAVATLAVKMREMGIGRGDRVAIAMRNLPEWPVIFFAAAAIGAIVVPLNAWWTAGELEYGINDSGARLLFVDDERHQRLVEAGLKLPAVEKLIVARASAARDGHASRLEDLIGTPHDYAALPDVDFPQITIAPDDDATIFYTSGTTGHPKGALGTHRNLMTNILSGGYGGARSLLRRGEAIPEPTPRTMLTVIPLFHVTACSASLMGVIATGSKMIFMRKWDAVRAMEIIESEKVNITGGVPTIAWQLIEHPDRDRFDLRSIESISYGGAPAAPDLVRRIHEDLAAMPGYGWGMTETSATVTHFAGEEYLARPASSGPAVAVADLKIVDPETLEEMPTGEIGELWARGPMVAREYWGKPEETARTFVEGWVRSGDLAYLDQDRFLYVVDRLKDIIIRGGENIYCIEVESVLYDHPAVVDAAVFGVPHRSLGEVPVAMVHLTDTMQASEAELQQWVAARLAPFKVPTSICFRDSMLPRNANGKILKAELVKAMPQC